jgi:hypothetical protein
VFLLSKSHKHFVTLGYVDAEGKQQAVVFRVHKGGIGAVLAGLEARTGRRVEYQDQEARKAGKDETRPRHSRCAGSGGCRGRSAP